MVSHSGAWEVTEKGKEAEKIVSRPSGFGSAGTGSNVFIVTDVLREVGQTTEKYHMRTITTR